MHILTLILLRTIKLEILNFDFFLTLETFEFLILIRYLWIAIQLIQFLNYVLEKFCSSRSSSSVEMESGQL